MINPLGFSLEQFDAIGRLRTRENGRPVDVMGSYKGRDGQTAKFFGARGLARFLAGSEEAHAAFVEKLFQHLTKQPARAYGSQTLQDLEQTFAANEFHMRKQVVEIMTAAALSPSRPEAPRSTPSAQRPDTRRSDAPRAALSGPSPGRPASSVKP
jgi:hypothetical protein